ncbi:hypothetical protein H0H92_014591, partial [Tricholoma furcatifolium]
MLTIAEEIQHLSRQKPQAIHFNPNPALSALGSFSLDTSSQSDRDQSYEMEGINDEVVVEENNFPAESSSNHSPSTTESQSTTRVQYQGASRVYEGGNTFMDSFNSDKFNEERKDNLYYPFASKDEWELSSFLMESGLRPEWNCKPWQTTYATKAKLNLYYRDPLECIQSLLHHPLLADSIQYTPFRLYTSAAQTMRIYTEWLSGNIAWEMQDKLPDGASLLGIILSSDKTNISAMTGGQAAHPLLLSLANIDMDFRSKALNHVFLLIGLLPIPKFIHKDRKIRGVLESRLFHECLDYILRPVKKAAEIGIMMSDPLGNLRYFFTPLASCIVDTPESNLIAGVASMSSSVTVANYHQLGDSFRHESRTAAKTIAQLAQIERTIDPWALDDYIKASNEAGLNGVHRPFWRDWALAEPSTFLTPEPLHHWHKMFFDHDIKWCIQALEGPEIDFRFSILHPHNGFRHFKEGISKLKQVTGREHRDMQRYLIPLIAGTVPKHFLLALRGLTDFRYLGQAPQISDQMCNQIQESLALFHHHKKAIIDAEARCGKGGAVIAHWKIPKLEFMQSVTDSIRDSGAVIQWSADVTERAHITEIKDPSRSTNNQQYESQICRHLDRQDKCRRFDLATAVQEAGLDLRTLDGSQNLDEWDLNRDEDTQIVDSTWDLLSNISPVTNLSGRPTRQNGNYFALAEALRNGLYPQAPLPYRSFVSGQTAIHLGRDPSFKRLSVVDVINRFKFQDLSIALKDYFGAVTIDCLEIWTKVRLQNKSYFSPHDILPSQALNALPPSEEWPFGHADIVLINNDPLLQWPSSGFKGHSIAQLGLIFRPIIREELLYSSKNHGFFCYTLPFEIIPTINRDYS